MLVIRAITLWYSNASFPEVICPLFREKTRNYIPEDVSQLEGGDGSPGTAEGVTRHAVPEAHCRQHCLGAEGDGCP